MVAMVSTITPTRIGRNWIPVKKPVGSIRAGGFMGELYDMLFPTIELANDLRLTRRFS
jgi:hypothetical protein